MSKLDLHPFHSHAAGDLPIEQPTRIELAINLKIAKGIGVALSKEMLNRADAVIEQIAS